MRTQSKPFNPAPDADSGPKPKDSGPKPKQSNKKKGAKVDLNKDAPDDIDIIVDEEKSTPICNFPFLCWRCCMLVLCPCLIPHVMSSP